MNFIDSIEFECIELLQTLGEWSLIALCMISIGAYISLTYYLGLYARELHEDRAPASELFIVLAMHVGLVGIVFLT